MSDKKWYLGSQNDILYILDGKPCQGNDHPIHDHGPNVLLMVPAGREADGFAKQVVDLHNESLSTTSDLLHSLKGLLSIWPLRDNEITLAAKAVVEKVESQS